MRAQGSTGKTVRIGVIGTGGMAHAHARVYARLRNVRMAACCDVSKERAAAFAAKWHIPASYTDAADMLSREKLDGVSIATPDATHAALSVLALEQGVCVLCEKPMAANLSEAEQMLAAAGRSGLVHMVNFSKRESSGLQAAREAVRAGVIGRVMHMEASYLQSWLVSTDWGDWRTTPAFTWRLSTRHGSAGTLGDIGCHIYDMASFLCGDITELFCKLAVYDKGVPGNRIGEYVLDANDSFASTVTFSGGAIGTIHATRWAVGFVNREFVRVYADKGCIDVDFNRSLNSYRIYLQASKKWKTVTCRPTPTNYERFVRAIAEGVRDESDFQNGFRIQQYLDASFRSDAQKTPVAISTGTAPAGAGGHT